MTLFLYILRDFFKYVVGIIFLSTFLFVMFDFIHQASTKGAFAKHNAETHHIVLYYAYQVPNLVVQGLPIASLLASVITMVLLSRTNEITAMRAAGMGPIQVGAPIISGGVFLSLLALFVGEVIAPITSKKMRYVQQVLIQGKPAAEVSEGSRWMRRGSTLYHFKDYDQLEDKMNEVRVIETGLNFRPKVTTEAREAFYQPDSKNWRLSDLRILYFNPNGTIAYTEKRESQIAFIPVEPQKLQKERRKPDELSIGELRDFINRGTASGRDVSTIKVDMHFKFAFYFAALVVCLAGLKFGYKSERTVETARGIILAIGIGISYYVIMSSVKALGKRGTIPPLAAAWMANFAIFAIGSYEIWRTTRKN